MIQDDTWFWWYYTKSMKYLEITFRNCVRKVPLSWIVVYSNIWAKISGQPWETSFLIVPKISSLIDQRCRPSIITKCVSLSHAVCGCRPTLFSASTNTHTHTLALSLSLCLFALFPHLFISDKNPLPRLFNHHWKYRFHCVWLFSFHR
jgi:hypothetical protein